MADAITTNLGLTKPEVGASDDTWGLKLNSNFDILDNMKAVITATTAPTVIAGALWYNPSNSTMYLGVSTSWVAISVPVGTSYTKTESDGLYYNKTQSDGLYYNKTQSDANYANKATQTTRDNAQDTTIATKLGDAPNDGSMYGRKSAAWVAVQKKSYIINGGMMVSQENGTLAGTASGYFPVDQWSVVSAGTTGTYSVAQVASSTPGGSPNRIRATVTTADAAMGAGDVVILSQSVEGYRVADLRSGSAAAKTVTVQVGCKGPAGTYCVAIRNNGPVRAYVSEITIAAGEANTDVVKSVTVPLDQTGTWATDNSIGMYVSIALMGGSTFQATPNTWSASNLIATANQFNFMSTNGNVFELFDVGLYEGSAAPAFQLPDFPTELTLCQRYWEKSYDYAAVPGSTGSGVAGAEATFFDGLTSNVHICGALLRFGVRKRAAPSNVTVYSYFTGAAGKINDANTNGDLTAVVDSLSESGARIYSTSTTASTTISRFYQWTANARM